MTSLLLTSPAHVRPLKPIVIVAPTNSEPRADRLPTVSASAALDELAGDASANIPSGLTGLDKALAANSPARVQADDSHPGGVTRGQVTELWGPPGAGKTALG